MPQSFLTVSQLNKYVKQMFGADYLLQRITVSGEVSNLKYHPSGHIYFSMKDAGGSLSCVMFAGQRSGLAFRMQEGQQVLVSGSVDVYERDGRYQLYAKRITLDGAGILYERFLALKKELEETGMFAPEYKKPIPPFAETVGIVTASSGAAIRDITSIAKSRNPGVRLILYPAKVQGEGAAHSIACGIEALNRTDAEIIIVGRGGGSIEDLWAFNEEEVARAIFASRVPVISAVGHETDTTIADFVADLRVPTPTAAAEAAVFKVSDVTSDLLNIQVRLRRSFQGKILEAKEQTGRLERRLGAACPESRLRSRREYALRIEDRLQRQAESILYENQLFTERIKTRLEQAVSNSMRDAKERYRILLTGLESRSPMEKLKSGFAYVENEKHEALSHISQIHPGERLTVTVCDGRIFAKATETEQIQFDNFTGDLWKQ